ncbi:MAG TPA: sensor histidine kinase [Anaerolineae bacterium]|nr:sensor histidine kinase [Anaerolineae bacterium]
MFSLNEVASKLKMVSEPALDQWSKALERTISGELLEVLRQRVQFTLHRIDRGFALELSRAESSLDNDGIVPQILLLDRDEYQLIREELSKAFKEQVYSSDLETCDKQMAESQIDFLIHILEDSVAVNLISALFNLVEGLEKEKHYIRKILSDVTEILEKDRQRLAFDLHDGPAQALSSALLQVDVLEDQVSSEEAKKELAYLRSILDQGLYELRTSMYSLKPQSMSQKGLIAKIKGYTKQFSSRTGIEVAILVEPEERELPGVIEVNIFRIVQEALNNVYKHARATHVVIKIFFSESQVSCTIEDNGIGFDASSRSSHMKGLTGYGLVSMGDRVGQFLGTFNVNSELGKGTRIGFSIPL